MMQALSLRQGIVHACKHIRASLHKKKIQRAGRRRREKRLAEQEPITWWWSDRVGETIILRPYGLPFRPDGTQALGLTVTQLIEYSNILGGRRVVILMEGGRSAFPHPRPALV